MLGFRQNVRRAVIALALVALVSGCSPSLLGQWVLVPSGVVESPDVTLTAQSGAFRLSGPVGTDAPNMFRTPFSIMCDELGALGSTTWKAAAERGAQPVEVLVPGRTKPLYGVLALCRVHPDDDSKGSRAHRIVIPKDRIAQTSGGNVTWVAEMGARDVPTWALWLSETPFPVQAKPLSTGKAPTPSPCSRLADCCVALAKGNTKQGLKERFGKMPEGDIGAELSQAKVGAPIRVKRVTPDGPAATALRPGDVVVSVGDAPVTTLAEARALIGSAKPGTKLSFGIERGGEWTPAQVVVAKLEMPKVSSCRDLDAIAAKRNQITCAKALRELVSSTRKKGETVPSSCGSSR